MIDDFSFQSASIELRRTVRVYTDISKNNVKSCYEGRLQLMCIMPTVKICDTLKGMCFQITAANRVGRAEIS